MTHKILDTNFIVKSLNEKGQFEGYASVFDDVDSVKDCVRRGAFKESLKKYQQKGRLPALLWQHNASEPIGVWREIFEDKNGLYVKGELFINDIPRARQAYKLLMEGGLSGLSIGFKTIESEHDPETSTRILTQIDLMEISMVTFPALDTARICVVKSRLNNKDIPNEREFEAFLRDAGFSRKQSKGLIANGYKSLSRRDASGQDNSDIACLYQLSETLRQMSV